MIASIRAVVNPDFDLGPISRTLQANYYHCFNYLLEPTTHPILLEMMSFVTVSRFVGAITVESMAYRLVKSSFVLLVKSFNHYMLPLFVIVSDVIFQSSNMYVLVVFT